VVGPIGLLARSAIRQLMAHREALYPSRLPSSLMSARRRVHLLCRLDRRPSASDAAPLAVDAATPAEAPPSSDIEFVAESVTQSEGEQLALRIAIERVCTCAAA
jgi:hypothetical protein